MIAKEFIHSVPGRVVGPEELRRGSDVQSPSSGAFFAQDDTATGEEHDAHGLVISLALCAVCWATLAWFLLG